MTELDPKVFLYNLLAHYRGVMENDLKPLAKRVADYIGERVTDFYFEVNRLGAVVANNPMIFPQTGKLGNKIIHIPSGELEGLFSPEFIEETVNS